LERIYQLTIEKPRAYISTTVKSVLIDTKRKHKPTQALPTNEDGELYQGNLLIKQCQEVQDPADIIVQKEALTESVTLAFNAIQTLPPRQRHATLCVLKDQLDDLHDLTAVAIRDIDIESICWPDERYEKQLLRASLAISRKKLHMLLSDRLSDH